MMTKAISNCMLSIWVLHLRSVKESLTEWKVCLFVLGLTYYRP